MSCPRLLLLFSPLRNLLDLHEPYGCHRLGLGRWTLDPSASVTTVRTSYMYILVCTYGFLTIYVLISCHTLGKSSYEFVPSHIVFVTRLKPVERNQKAKPSKQA